jgi:predicted DNA-binding transcriptional regulator AlpA
MTDLNVDRLLELGRQAPALAKLLEMSRDEAGLNRLEQLCQLAPTLEKLKGLVGDSDIGLPAAAVRHRLLSLQKSAEFLDISVRTLTRMSATGVLPKPLRINRRELAHPLGALIDFVNRRAAEASEAA